MTNIDNTKLVRSFLKANLTEEMENNEFYKFDLIVRRKDNPENKFVKNHKDSFLVHSYLISSLAQFDKYIDEMISLAYYTGARIYMTLDRKSTTKMAYNLAEEGINLLKSMAKRNVVSLKNMFNLTNSITSRGELSVHLGRKILIDIDDRRLEVLSYVTSVIYDRFKGSNNDVIYVLYSPNGFHLILPRYNFEEVKGLFKDMREVEVKENALTLVYFNNERKDEE